MLLELRNIGKSYGEKCVLSGISYGFEAGKCYALLGENGAGKSTLAAVISGEKQPSSGSIFILGMKQKRHTVRSALKNGIALVPQTPTYSKSATILENIIVGSEFKTQLKGKALASYIDSLNEKWRFSLSLKKQIRNQKEALLASVLAAFIGKPRFILLDEADSPLEPPEKARFFSLLSTYIKKENAASLIITHERGDALEISDEKLFLSHGSLSAKVEEEREFYFGEERDTKREEEAPHGEEARRECEKSSVLSNYENSVEFFETEQKDETPSAEAGKAENYVEFRFGKRLLSASSGRLTCVRFYSSLSLQAVEQTIMKSELGGREMEGEFFARLGGKEYRRLLTSDSYSPRFLRKLGAALLPLDKKEVASSPSFSVQELLTATDIYSPSSDKSFAEKILRRSSVAARLNQKVSSLSGGMRLSLILERELYNKENLPFVLFFEPLQGLDRKRAASLCRILHETAKTAAVMIFTQSEFPVNSSDYVILFE